MAASHNEVKSVDDNSYTPEEYFDIELNNKHYFKPIKLANYCYSKLNEVKHNGIGFPLLLNIRNITKVIDGLDYMPALIRAWQHKHYMLLAHFAPTHEWKKYEIDVNVNAYLENPNGKPQLPTALVHNVRIKSLLREKKFEEALALMKQSNLHLNLSGERICEYLYDDKPINFKNANLERTNLVKTDFFNCCLQGANLKNAVLWGADLRKADLRGADLTNAELDFADLKCVRLDENTATCIINFVVNKKNHFPVEYHTLRESIINNEEKNISLRVQDCLKLLSLCHYMGSNDYAQENLLDNVEYSSPAFQLAINELDRQEKQSELCFSLNMDNTAHYRWNYNDDRDYKPFANNVNENIFRSCRDHAHYIIDKNDITDDYRPVFKNSYFVHSRYLVTELKNNKKLIWDIKNAKDSPLVTIDYSEEEKDQLDPKSILYKDIQDIQYHEADFLNHNEIVAFVRSWVKADVFTYRLCFFEKDILQRRFKEIKAQPLKIQNSVTPVSCAAISNNQFAIVYSNNVIELWERQINSQDRFDFISTKMIDVARKSLPFCNKINENGKSVMQSHYCERLITRNKNNKDSLYLRLFSKDAQTNVWTQGTDFTIFKLLALNSEELILIQENPNYQIIQKINFKLESVTHQIELVRPITLWLASARSFFPLADGNTFYVVSTVTDAPRKNNGFVFDAKSMAFYRIRGFHWFHERPLGVLKTGETISTISYGSGGLSSYYINEALPHVTAYLKASEIYIKEQLDNQLSMYFYRVLGEVVKAYINSDVILSNDKKSELTPNLASFYGEPEIISNGLIPSNPQNYSCYKRNHEAENADEENDIYGDSMSPTFIQFKIEEEKKDNNIIQNMKVNASELTALLKGYLNSNNMKIESHKKLWNQANEATGEMRTDLLNLYNNHDGDNYIKELMETNINISNMLKILDRVSSLTTNDFLTIDIYFEMIKCMKRYFYDESQIQNRLNNILQLERQRNYGLRIFEKDNDRSPQLKDALKNLDKECDLAKQKRDKRAAEQQLQLARYHELRNKARKQQQADAKDDEPEKGASCTIC